MSIQHRLRYWFVSVAFGLLCSTSTLFAETRYVKAGASGTGDGTTLQNAWTTLAAINQANLNAGDVVLIHSGTYDERLTITKSGTSSSARITYKGVNDGGGMPIVRGIAGGSHDYIGVIGIEFTHTSSAYNYPAIRLDGGDGWLIQDNYIHNTYERGVAGHFGTVNSFNVIRGNTFYDLTFVGGANRTAAGRSFGNTVHIFGNSNLVEYNVISRGLDRIKTYGTGNVVRNNYLAATDTVDYPGAITVSSVSVTNGGSGYTSAPTVTFGVPGDGGVTATGIAVLGTGADADKVVSVTRTNNGWGYTSAPAVTFTGGGGSGATAVAYINPSHTDGFQSDAAPASTLWTQQLLFERNWDEDNKDSVGNTNGHGVIIQNQADHDGMKWAILRFNFQLRTAGTAYEFQNFHRTYGYNNTSSEIKNGAPSIWQSAVTFDPPPFTGRVSDLQDWRNNTWSYSPKTMGGIFATQNAPTNFTSSHQHRYDAGALPAGSANNVGGGASTDPKFTNVASDDYTLASDSPLRGASGAITTAVGAGTDATSLVVADAKRLFDGWGIADADIVKVGAGSYVRISSINYDTNTVTLSAARSWSDGDGVFIKGSEDIGAFPYAFAVDFSVTNTTPLTDTVTGAMNLTATVSNTDAVRMVEFLVDGIPVGIDYDSPYSVSWTSDGYIHDVEARAYSAWASKTLSKRKFNTAPQFTVQPTSQNAFTGGSVTFTAVATAPEAPSYQWRKNGVNISGATNSSFTIVSVASGDAATYSVVATNSIDSETSNDVTLTLVSPPFTTGTSGVRANNENNAMGEFGVGTTTRTDLLRNSTYLHSSSTEGVTVAASGSGTIRFATGGTDAANERLTITADGDVGIGIPLPNARLEVFDAQPNQTVRLHLTNGGGAGATGELRIGSFADSAGFHVSSNANPQHTSAPSASYSSDQSSRTSFEILNVNGTSLSGGSSFTDFRWGSSGTFTTTVRFQGDGNVGIGTGTGTLTDKLTVNGSVKANSFIAPGGTWADHVFADEYSLTPLTELERFTKENRHLPGIPSAKEAAEKGVDLVQMQTRLLEKVEELTLHLIAQEKKLTDQAERIQRLEQENQRLRQTEQR